MDVGNTANRPNHRTTSAGTAATATPTMSPEPKVDNVSKLRSTRSQRQGVLTPMHDPERIRLEPTVAVRLLERLTRATSRPGTLQEEPRKTERIRENTPAGLADLLWSRPHELCSAPVDFIVDMRLATAIADHTDYLVTRIVPKLMESELFIDSLIQAVQRSVTSQSGNTVPRTTPQVNHPASICQLPTELPGVGALSAPHRDYHQENSMVGQSRSRREALRLDGRKVSHQENQRVGQARSRREVSRLEERPLSPPHGLCEVQPPQGFIGSERGIDFLGANSFRKKRSNRRRRKHRRRKRRDHSDTRDSESASTDTTDSEVNEATVRGLRPVATIKELFDKVLDYRN
ncbi:unnamed protein product [Agarophyton chilense]